jgi:hypothetical protein
LKGAGAFLVDLENELSILWSPSVRNISFLGGIWGAGFWTRVGPSVSVFSFRLLMYWGNALKYLRETEVHVTLLRLVRT